MAVAQAASVPVGVQVVAWLYVIVNTGRVCFYIPQLRALLRARGAARAVSTLTWAAFTLSHFTTLLYALVVVADWMLAMISALNMAFSLAICVVAAVKQTAPARRRGMIRRVLPMIDFLRMRAR